VVVGPALAALALLACGSSKHSSSSASTPASSSSASGSRAGPRTSGTPRSAQRYPARTTAGGRQAGTALNARVPVTFTIRGGDAVVPPTVSSPAFIAIRLTVLSADGKPHYVVLLTPSPRSLTVPPGGQASALVPGLKAGRYLLQVDGARRAALMVGGEPGP
jgi:hypothetical protein